MLWSRKLFLKGMVPYFEEVCHKPGGTDLSVIKAAYVTYC